MYNVCNLLNLEENQVQLMSLAAFPAQLLRFLEVDKNNQLKGEVVRLLLIISQTESGRASILTNLDLSKFVKLGSLSYSVNCDFQVSECRLCSDEIQVEDGDRCWQRHEQHGH